MGTMQHVHDLNLRETFTDGKDIPSPPEPLKPSFTGYIKFLTILSLAVFVNVPAQGGLKTALLKIHTKKKKVFPPNFGVLFAVWGCYFKRALIGRWADNPSASLTSNCQSTWSRWAGRGGKKDTQSQKGSGTQRHTTHKSKYKPCFGSIRGPAGDTLAEFSRKSASAFLVIKLMPGVRDGLRSLLSPLIHLCLLTGPVSCSDIIVFPQSIPFTLASLCWFDRAARCWDRLSHTVKRGLFIFCSSLCMSEPKTLSVSLPRSEKRIWEVQPVWVNCN